MKNILNLILGLCVLSACSDEVAVTYNCVPTGATVYEEGVGKLGVCPVTAKYSPYDVKVSDGKLYTNKMKVVWVSGASLLVPPGAIDLSRDDKASVTFTRPQIGLGSEQDQKFSVAYEESLVSPGEQHIITPGQYRDFFDAFNGKVTCAFDDLIEADYSECP